MEPEDYFQHDSDLSRYAKEAEKIKVINPGDWRIEAGEEKPREPKLLHL